MGWEILTKLSTQLMAFKFYKQNTGRSPKGWDKFHKSLPLTLGLTKFETEARESGLYHSFLYTAKV